MERKLYDEVLKSKFEATMKEINEINQLLFGLRSFDLRGFWAEDYFGMLDSIVYNKNKDRFELVFRACRRELVDPPTQTSVLMESMIKEKIEDIMKCYTLYYQNGLSTYTLRGMERDIDEDMIMFFD